MNNQWPLFVAGLLIGIAAGFGFYQREEAIATATPQDIARPLPSPGTTSTATSPAVATPASVATPTPAPAPATPAVVKRRQPPAEAPQPNAAPPANPAIQVGPAPQTAPAANPRPRAQGRFQVLLDLQEDLKTRLQMVPIPLPNGGYKFSMEGAHLEVATTPSWLITIYNINPKQPEVETDNFKTLLAAVTTALGVNTNQKPVEAGTGKTYLRTVSKMGSISLERDPATGNSAVIRPMTPTPAVDVAQPVQPVPQALPQAGKAAPVPPPPAVDNSKKPGADF